MHKSKGFTLIEMLIVIAIIAGLAALVIPMIGGVREDAAVTTALNEMKNIKESIRDRFYPDLGLIPEDAANPGWASRFLCFTKDCRDEDIRNATSCLNIGGNPIEVDLECEEMCIFLSAYLSSFAEVQRFLQWDKYSHKGWNGPYMERESVVVYDDNGTPGNPMDDKGYPVIIDPWEEIFDHDLFGVEVIGGYRIFGGQDKNLAQIVSYGRLDADGDGNRADCDVVIGTDGNNYVCIQRHTPVAAVNRPITGTDWQDYWALDNTQSGSVWVSGVDYETFGGDDLVMFIFGTQPVRRP